MSSSPGIRAFLSWHFRFSVTLWKGGLCRIQWGFSAISTFAHLPHVKCLTAQDVEFDIGIVGVPFDTAVSYRPGEFGHLFSRSLQLLPWNLESNVWDLSKGML